VASRGTNEQGSNREMMSQQLTEARRLLVASHINPLGASFPPVRVFDSPPIPPEVTIVPLRDDPTKLMIMLQQATDKIVLPYVALTTGEQRDFERIRDQQRHKCDLLCAPNTIEFKSEGNDVLEWEVFRTTSMPARAFEKQPQICGNEKEDCIIRENFADDYRRTFGSQPYRIVETSMASALTDTIEPNKKYYYMFRTRDRHGHISNPSVVFQVEMVKDGEMFFPIIKTYESDPDKPRRSREFAKTIDIRLPRLSSQPQWADGVWKTGARTENAYGKSFLVRVISKDTGRSFDIEVEPKYLSREVEYGVDSLEEE